MCVLVGRLKECIRCVYWLVVIIPYTITLRLHASCSPCRELCSCFCVVHCGIGQSLMHEPEQDCGEPNTLKVKKNTYFNETVLVR